MAKKFLRNKVTDEVRILDTVVDAAEISTLTGNKPWVGTPADLPSAASDWEDVTPSGGGATAPTDILVLGTDVPFINGWLAPDPDDDGEPIGRMYKQGGRVHFFGSIKAPGGAGGAFVVPAGYLPYDFGDDVLGIDLGFAIVSNWNTARFLEVVTGGGVNISPAPNAGVLVQLDGISWPLAP